MKLILLSLLADVLLNFFLEYLVKHIQKMNFVPFVLELMLNQGNVFLDVQDVDARLALPLLLLLLIVLQHGLVPLKSLF